MGQNPPKLISFVRYLSSIIPTCLLTKTNWWTERCIQKIQSLVYKLRRYELLASIFHIHIWGRDKKVDRVATGKQKWRFSCVSFFFFLVKRNLSSQTTMSKSKKANFFHSLKNNCIKPTISILCFICLKVSWGTFHTDKIRKN